MSVTFERDLTLTNLNSGEWTLLAESGKSEVWKKFKKVCNSQSKQYLGLVMCTQCKAIKKYNPKTGTGILKRHICPSQDTHLCTANTGLSLVDAKREFKNACVNFCAGDIKPYHTVSGTNYKNMIQSAMDIARALPEIGAEDIIPDRRVVSKATREDAEEARQKVLPGILEAVSSGNCSASTDMWTDDVHKHHYLAVTTHTIKDFKLMNQLLFISQFPNDVPETGENIKQELVKKFGEVGVSTADLKKITFVTDNGSNIIKALEGHERLYCSAHCINIIAKDSISVKLKDAEFFDSATLQKMDATAKVLTDTGRPDLGAKISFGSHTKKFVSKVKTLENFLKDQDTIYSHLSETADIDTTDIIVQKEEIQDLINVIRPIEERASRHVGHYLLGSDYDWIINHCSTEFEDSDFLQNQKARLFEEFSVLKINKLIDDCKSLVTYFKKSGLVSRLKTTLKQCVDTRWNSVVNMLESIAKNFDEVTTILEQMEQLHRLARINLHDINTLIEFLKPFEEETDRLQGENAPTLLYVVLSLAKLKNHCQANINDPLYRIRKKALDSLNEKFIIHDRQKVAVFLWPEFRHLKMFSQDERAQVHVIIHDWLEKLSGLTESSSTPPKRARKDDGFDQWRDVDLESDPRDEVQIYLHENVGVTALDGNNILQWWKERSPRLPLLSKLAACVLATPATSAPSERIFSTAGATLSERRACLKPSTVEDLLFLHNFLKNQNRRPCGN